MPKTVAADFKELKKQLKAAAAATAVPTLAPQQKATPSKEGMKNLFGRPITVFHGLTLEDKSQFKQAVRDVTPYPALNVVSAAKLFARPRPIPIKSQADELAALLASYEAVSPSPRNTDLGLDFEEDQSYLSHQGNPDLLRKLKRGVFVTQAELDLHHHNQEEAHAALGIFMSVVKAEGKRCVRIIHGKGTNSFQREPVLKSKVRRWLQLRADVLAYCEPKEHAGGSGAVLVLLS